ncbi:MAG: phosphoribosylformimino-5-aminoimidazole carboxamide ribotide isomerase, partial [Lachnospiraceae bacterium]|nr:phosphoribosylformimino-5-aminoimidazole carboxamide ribotide isomerase [Lachnospiraceae bacterium]
MQLYPAIDIKQGQCVRLKQGLFKDIEVYSNQPWEIAKKWEDCGATFIHVVDLDGALEGYSVNADVIAKIAASVSCPIQLGLRH